jgi:glycosidase
MADVPVPTEEVKDPRELREPGIGLGRDPVRTPMAWDGTPHAGFSSGKPWLPLHVDWPIRNVEAENSKPASMLGLYRALLGLRRAEPALSVGSIELVDAGRDVLAYERRDGQARLFVALNFSSEPRTIGGPDGELILSTVDLGALEGALRANEGIIMRMAD